MNGMATGYWTSNDITSRYKISKRTLSRWMNLGENPFPRPRIACSGASNRWAIDDVVAWENGTYSADAAA